MIDAVRSFLPAVSPETPTKTDEAEGAFAELFVRTMLGEVQRAMPEGSLLGGDLEMFGDLLLDEIAGRIAHADALDLGTPIRRPTTAILPVQGRLSSNFGRRSDPIHGHERHHDGVDIAAPRGTPIRATLPGTVVFAGERGGYGNTVVVRHADGSEALYAHCDRLDVRAGDLVTQGRPIATVGSTGRSTGPHLHLEVRLHGQAVDPMEHLGLEGR